MKRAILEFPDGRRAILTPKGWHVSPPDPDLERRLEDFSPSDWPGGNTIPPDALAYTARRAGWAVGADDVWVDPISEAG